MQKILSKYATAAHLAILAVAPLFLLPFLTEKTVAAVELWLVAFSAVWILLEPSRRSGEMSHDARKRVVGAAAGDPLFWFSLVLVGCAAVRALNGGIALTYDAELMRWSIASPSMSMLPGCVSGAGTLAFSVTVALVLVFQAARHALGRAGREAFFIVSSTLSAVAAILFSFAISYHFKGVEQLTRTSYLEASFFGSVFGLQLLVSAVALFAAVERKWMKAEPVAILAMVGNALGLVVFAPPATIVVYAAAFLLLVALSFVLMRRRLEGSGSFRCALAVVLAFTAPVLYALATDGVPAMADKIAAFKAYAFFPDGFMKARTVLSGIALKTWRANPWLGTGLGSFPLDIRFAAVSADWQVLSPLQHTALNGWWQLLAERGVIGALMIAVALGMIVWTYFSRLIGSFRQVAYRPMQFAGPVALLALVALAFVDCSFLRPEMLLIAGVLTAFSCGSFPERRKSAEEDKEN